MRSRRPLPVNPIRLSGNGRGDRMQQSHKRFDEALSAIASRACRLEPTVATVPPRSTMVVIPQRAIRRPILSFDAPPFARMVTAPGGAGDVRVRLYLWL